MVTSYFVLALSRDLRGGASLQLSPSVGVTLRKALIPKFLPASRDASACVILMDALLPLQPGATEVTEGFIAPIDERRNYANRCCWTSPLALQSPPLHRG